VARKRKRPHSEANKFEQWLGTGALDERLGADMIDQMDADNPLPVPQKMVIDTEFTELHNTVMEQINGSVNIMNLLSLEEYQRVLRSTVGVMLVVDETYPDFNLDAHSDMLVVITIYLKLIEIERGKRNGWTHDSE
jgi:hypothetical protein